MRLKVATTATFFVGLVMLGAWPWMMAGKPPPRTREMAQYLLKTSIYFIVLLVIFFATVVLAWLTVRKTREEYQAQKLDNLKELIEATLEDHGKPPE